MLLNVGQDISAPTGKAEFPWAFQFLFEKARYKVAYGGRGSGKSWAFARYLILRAASEPGYLCLCTREIQKSIQESVLRLLADQINEMGLADHFEIQRSTIKGKNGSQFIFEGLRHNIYNIKSYEGVDTVWVEEAQTVSDLSWRVLIPTIRKEGSEIIVSFNPDLEEDPTYQRFVIHAPPGAEVHKVNFTENPYCPQVLKDEAKLLEMTDPVQYRNVWLGECKQAVEGAIFAQELEKAKEERRLTVVKPELAVPVNTYWDLGRSDNTAIWFAQLVGMEWRLVDYYEANGQQFKHFLEIMLERGYNYGTMYLPHDAANELLAADYTIEQQARRAIEDNPKLGDDVTIVPRVTKKSLAIDAARGIFSRCVFDSEATQDGLQCLRRYRYDVDAQTGRVGKNPKHDIHSHGADAFLTMAQSASQQPSKKVTLREFYSV